MSVESITRDCPLCGQGGGRFFHDDGREFRRCGRCRLVFVRPADFPSRDDERAVYERHENSPDDPRYRRFLSRLFHPVAQRLEPGSRGLDFGSGPGPTLSVMFEEAGHSVSLFDPFYAPDPAVFDRQYDFVTASEVVEHLQRPREDLERMWGCLLPGGVLGLMTKRVRDRAAFSKWHYKNDPTHVCFFALETFEWLADHWGARLDVAGDDVVLFQKRDSQGLPGLPSALVHKPGRRGSTPSTHVPDAS